MTLPKSFKPQKDFELIRCGRNYDGGYLVSKKTILEAETLISFGILDDCSFENDFIKIKPVEVHCYDNTVNKTYWKKRIYNDLGASLFNLNWKFFKNTIQRYLEFKKFFKRNKNFLNIKTIKTGTISEIINDKNFKSPLFFKIDIEGSEYRVLDEIIKFQNLVCGLVIEFHDIDLHLNKVQSFIKHFNLKLTHIHPNNYAMTNINGDPTVIEMTFEKNPAEIGKELILPNKFDQPNNPEKKNIDLIFEQNLPDE